MHRFLRPISIFALVSLLITTGIGCGGGSSAAAEEPVTLEYWRVFDDEDTMETIMKAYRTSHPNVKINYRKLRLEEYEGELVRALAEGRGPDIMTIHNTWLPGYTSLLTPIPDSIKTTARETQGTLRKEQVVVEKTTPGMSLRTLKSLYVDQVSEDVVLPYQPDPKIKAVDKIFALPLAVDSLVLFYNKDLLNAAGISEVPNTWEKFQTAVTSLTVYDDDGNIKQSGAAIGTADNVERSTDILSLLMMQNGTQMTDDNDNITLANRDKETDSYPGLQATNFYTDFANPTKKVYTWNEEMPDSFEAFTTGKTAFFFGYSYHIPLIRTAAPKLSFGISGMPQISAENQQVNFANYWVEAVSKSTKYPEWAWDFVTFATSEEQVGSYLAEAKKPTAIRGLIQSQLEDEDLGTFARQTLTAQSWYHGNDATAAESALEDLITAILSQPEKPEQVLADTAKKVDQTYK